MKVPNFCSSECAGWGSAIIPSSGRRIAERFRWTERKGGRFVRMSYTGPEFSWAQYRGWDINSPASQLWFYGGG